MWALELRHDREQRALGSRAHGQEDAKIVWPSECATEGRQSKGSCDNAHLRQLGASTLGIQPIWAERTRMQTADPRFRKSTSYLVWSPCFLLNFFDIRCGLAFTMTFRINTLSRVLSFMKIKCKILLPIKVCFFFFSC